VRLRRVVGSYSVGRIVNPRTPEKLSLSGDHAWPAPRFRGGKNLLSAIL
jgi:hypothetical protein